MWRLYNTQKDLKEEREDTAELKETISQLQGDMVKLAALKKQLDQNNGSV
jgi:bacterioferritin (cytochrome b1)